MVIDVSKYNKDQRGYLFNAIYVLNHSLNIKGFILTNTKLEMSKSLFKIFKKIYKKVNKREFNE